MRRAWFSLVLAVLILSGVTPCDLSAQTYNPKSIRFESSDPSQQLDRSELLQITGLHEGAPVTKDEIEAALQKLADSGAFTNLTYTVNNTALTIKLTPAGAGGQALPVRFTNFVWWDPNDLIRILEQRVPLFHGTLPLQGNQTGQIEDALVALLAEKGIPNAKITASPSSFSPGDPMNAVALSITSPEILVGETHFDGVVPAVAERLTTLGRQLAGSTFDLREVNSKIHDITQDIFTEAGYLDFTNDPPIFATPRGDLTSYVVDVQVNLNPGPLYHISQIAIHPAPPLTDPELRAVLPFKTGDLASVIEVRKAVTALAHVYGDYAYLQTKASCDIDKNASNHTVTYTFSVVPGPQFRLASVDTSALPTDLQQEFVTLWHFEPGALIDKQFQSTLRDTVEKLHSRTGISVTARKDSAANTVVIFLRPGKVPGNLGSPEGPLDTAEPSATIASQP